MYAIEKDIPLPQRSSGKESKFPFADMQPGDSIVIPLGTSKAYLEGRFPGTEWVCSQKQKLNLPPRMQRVWRVK